MRDIPRISIDFRIGSERYARSTWWAVPHIGDHVSLGAGKDRYPADHNGDAMFLVKQVVWGAESVADRDRDWQSVIVFVEHQPA